MYSRANATRVAGWKNEYRVAEPVFKRIFKKLKNEIVQDVPSELEECLVCGKNSCSHEKWANCENRIAHMKKRDAHRKSGEKAENEV